MCIIIIIELLNKIFVTFIRSLIKYGHFLWNPWSIHKIERLKSIQHRLASLANKQLVNYDQQLPF